MSKLVPPEDIKTFSIAFSEKSFDESSYARQVAAHFGTDHREEILYPQDLIDLLPEVSDLLDEPLGDASIIPTLALSRFARKYVTVAIGGDGGDELFAGYPTFQAEVYAKKYRTLPRFLRKGLIEPFVKRLPVSDDNISLDFKIKQFIKGADTDDLSRHMLWMGSFSPKEQEGLLTLSPFTGIFEDLYRYESFASETSMGNRILYAYKKLYLAEDILTKVDRASMWSSLEARAPFMDHEFVDFVFRLPYAMKFSGMTMKYILKKAFGPLLPKAIVSRPKKGFGMPVAKWIKGPLREMTTDILAPEKIAREGFFRPKEVTGLLRDHLTGKVDNRKKLWTLIVFEKWLARWGQGRS
jgi:asparagine synthase (glutamine-hydrolysing)